VGSSPAATNAGTGREKGKNNFTSKSIHLIVGHYKQYSKYIIWYKYWQTVTAQW
jgi:hypothetical protein